MHLMPREGTETNQNIIPIRIKLMHLMPREGTETLRYMSLRNQTNASYAP